MMEYYHDLLCFARKRKGVFGLFFNQLLLTIYGV